MCRSMRSTLPPYLQRGSELARVRFLPMSSAGDAFSILYEREEICQIRPALRARDSRLTDGSVVAAHESAKVYEGIDRFLWKGDNGHTTLDLQRLVSFGRKGSNSSGPMMVKSRWRRSPRVTLALGPKRFLRDRLLTNDELPVARIRPGSYASWGVRPIREVFVDESSLLVATLRLAILLNFFVFPPDNSG